MRQGWVATRRTSRTAEGMYATGQYTAVYEALRQRDWDECKAARPAARGYTHGAARLFVKVTLGGRQNP